MKDKIEVGKVAINSIVCLPRQSARYQVISHENGYTQLQEILDKEICDSFKIGPSYLVLVDWMLVMICEGF